ncbi:MAG: hypothetical protein ACOH2R_20630 [Pseudomonas sp.]
MTKATSARDLNIELFEGNEPAMYIGCAGWTTGRESLSLFADAGTHLEGYASQLGVSVVFC